MSASKSTFDCVLVVGGCGFQGHNLVTKILEAEPNCKVYVLDIDINRSSRRHESAKYITGNIANSSDVNNALQQMNPRVIFHTACPPSMAQDADLHWRVNVDGTRNLLNAAEKLGSVHTFIISSTSSVGYDGVAELKMVSELPILDAAKQSRGYSRSKGVAEQEVISANRRNGMLTCAVRPCTTFGPDDPHFFENILNVVKNGQAKYRFGRGENLFDFIYVDNASHAHLLAARALLAAHGKPPLPADQRVEGEAFNITNDEHIPFWDLTIRTSNIFGHSISHDEIVSIPKAVGLLLGFVAEWVTWILSMGTRQPALSVAAVQYTFLTHTMNIEKSKKRLGYQPRVTLQEGLERTVEWYRENDKQQ